MEEKPRILQKFLRYQHLLILKRTAWGRKKTHWVFFVEEPMQENSDKCLKRRRQHEKLWFFSLISNMWPLRNNWPFSTANERRRDQLAAYWSKHTTQLLHPLFGQKERKQLKAVNWVQDCGSFFGSISLLQNLFFSSVWVPSLHKE